MSTLKPAGLSLALRILDFVARHADGSQRPWIDAICAETPEIPSALGKVWWAATALPMAWTFPRKANARDKASSVVLGVALVAGMRRRRADLAALALAIALGAIVAVLALFVLPVYRELMAGMGLGSPIPMRMAFVFLNSSTPLVALLSVLVWFRLRYPHRELGIRRVLMVANVVLVGVLAGMTSGFVHVARVVPRELGTTVIRQALTSYAARVEGRKHPAARVE